MSELIKKSHKTLAGKITATAGVTIAVFFIIGGTFLTTLFYSNTLSLWKEKVWGITSLYASNNAQYLERNESAGIAKNSALLIKNPEVIYCRVYDAAGRIVSPAEYAKPADLSRTNISRYSHQVINVSGKVLGHVEIGFSRRVLIAGLAHFPIILFTILALFTAIIVLILRRRINSIVTIPLQDFLETAKLLSQGYFSREITISSDDEIGLLALEFNKMKDDLKKNQDLLVHSQKMESIGTLAGGIAHEFNNILGGIIGNLSLLRFKLKNGSGKINASEIDEYLESIETISQKAAGLSKQLSTLSRRHDSSLIPVDLCTVIPGVLDICAKTFDRKIAITGPQCTDTAFVLADPIQIEQAVLNICINAAHSMTIMRKNIGIQGGNLRISLHGPVLPSAKNTYFYCDSEISYWQIKINDDGVGMSKEEIERIFDPFFTTKTRAQGSGLGMTIVYSIISKHDGFVTIDSVKDKGTEVSLFIPVYAENTVVKKNGRKSGRKLPPKGEGLVLIADDEDYILQLAGSILSFGGYESITARDGSEAVKIFIEHQDDIKLVILDMIMPNKNGMDAYNEIKLVNPDARILFSSGLRNRENEPITEIPDDAAFLPKPYTAEQLLQMVDRLIVRKIKNRR